MTAKELSNGILRTIAILTAVVITLFLVQQLASLVLYLIISLLLTLLGNPIVLFLEKKLKMKKLLAVIITLLLFITTIVGLALLFVPLIQSQGENLSLLDINKMENNYNKIITNIDLFLKGYGYNFSEILNSSTIFSSLNLKFIPSFFNSIVAFIGNLGVGLLSVLFITFFFLKESDKFYIAFQFILPNKQKDRILHSLNKINTLLSRYFGGLLLQLSIILILNSIVFLIFDVQNALVIALLCAILNIIPYLGPLLGMVVASSLIMISGIGNNFVADVIPTVFYVLIGMFIVQLIDSNINQPYIFSKSTKSHPLEIFLVIIASGTLFGIVGMVVAIPVYTSLKVIAKQFFPKNKIIQVIAKQI